MKLLDDYCIHGAFLNRWCAYCADASDEEGRAYPDRRLVVDTADADKQSFDAEEELERLRKELDEMRATRSPKLGRSKERDAAVQSARTDLDVTRIVTAERDAAESKVAALKERLAAAEAVCEIAYCHDFKHDDAQDVADEALARWRASRKGTR